MKILFIHLSDTHMKDRCYIDETIVDSQVQSLNALEKFDKCCIIFSGDIAFSGKENEYKNASYYLRQLVKKIKDKFFFAQQ